MALTHIRARYVESGASAQCEVCGGTVHGPNEIYVFVDEGKLRKMPVNEVRKRFEARLFDFPIECKVDACFECRRLCVAASSIVDVKKYARLLT